MMSGKNCVAKKARSVLKDLKTWLLEHAPESNGKIVPKSKIGKAISYALGMWHRIERYLEDGRYEIDNNWVENSIRPVALGRKNYLFAGSHQAAQRAAMIYSLLATCKKNNVEASAWLTDVITKIQDQPINKIEELLPENWLKSYPHIYPITHPHNRCTLKGGYILITLIFLMSCNNESNSASSITRSEKLMDHQQFIITCN